MNLFFIFLVLFFPAHRALTVSPSESAVVDSIQAAWDQIRSYQADFKQVIKSKTFGTEEETQGKIFVVKPLKLRWEPTNGGATQILNGNEFWQLRLSKRRKRNEVDHYSDITHLVDLRSLSFLSGKVNIKKSYKYRVLRNDSNSLLVALSAVSGGGDTLLAEILKPSYLLGALKMENPQSETRIDFKNIQTNVPLEGSLFKYQANPQDIVHEHQR